MTTGKILQVNDARSFWLLTVDTPERIFDQVIEPRFMEDIVAAEGLESPYDFKGRDIEISDDGLSVEFP